MTVRYIYLDKSKNSIGFNSGGAYTHWHIFTDDDYVMDILGSNGENSASDPVATGVLVPFDDDYWFTDAAASGYAVLRTEPITLSPDTLSLIIRHRFAGSGVYIENIYVLYDDDYNIGIGSIPKVIASGFFNRYNFPSQGSYTNTELQLNLNTALINSYPELLISGIPTVTFDYHNINGSAANQRISEFNLFASGEPLVPSFNSTCNLYIRGHQCVPCGDCFLLDEYGNILLDEFENPLIEEGCVDTTVLLYMSGGVPSSTNTCTLFTHGFDYSSGNIPLYIEGAILSSGSIPLFIHGFSQSSGNIPLYIYSNTLTSGNIPLLITGGADIDLDYNIDLFIIGSGGGLPASGSMPLVISSTPRCSGMLDLIVYNNYNVSSGICNLHTLGGGLNGDSLPGSVPISGSMILVIWREFEGVKYSLPLYIGGPISVSGLMPLYIDGGPSLTSNIDLFISGIDPRFNTVKLFMKGI